jgi:hypothetical protein
LKEGKEKNEEKRGIARGKSTKKKRSEQEGNRIKGSRRRKAEVRKRTKKVDRKRNRNAEPLPTNSYIIQYPINQLHTLIMNFHLQ